MKNIRKRLYVQTSRQILDCIFPAEGNIENLVLTKREQEVFALIMKGKSLHEIAHDLQLSKSTIKNHKAHMLIMNNCSDMLQLMAKFYDA